MYSRGKINKGISKGSRHYEIRCHLVLLGHIQLSQQPRDSSFDRGVGNALQGGALGIKEERKPFPGVLDCKNKDLAPT